MPVLKHRDRMVVFRVTQDEYEKLLLACARRGARSVTDFIRSEVLASILEQEPPTRGERAFLSAIDQKLARLQSDLDRLLRMAEEQPGGAEASGSGE